MKKQKKEDNKTFWRGLINIRDLEKMNSASINFEYVELLINKNKVIYIVYYVYDTPCHFYLCVHDFKLSLQVIVPFEKVKVQQSVYQIADKIRKIFIRNMTKIPQLIFYDTQIEIHMILR